MSSTDPFALVRQAFAAPDHADRVQAITALRDQLDTLELDAVRAIVRSGGSWSEVSKMLGVSKQSAHRRFAKRIHDDEPVPAAAPPEPKIVVTPQARRAVRSARAAARALGHGEVDTSHLLLGLMADADGPATRALEAIGVDFDQVCEAVTEQQPPTTPPVAGPVPIAPVARDALEQALREARRLNHAHLGVEHLLLGTVRDPEGCAVRALADLGVSPVDLERCLGKVLMEAPFNAR